MISNTDENRARCVCGRCPSHLAGDATLFCATGASDRAVQERGCLCRTCPVHLQYNPPGRFYCLRGAAKE